MLWSNLQTLNYSVDKLAYRWRTRVGQPWTIQPSVHTTDPAPAVSHQEGSEGSSAVTSIHLIYAVDPCKKLVILNVWVSVSLPALNYMRVRTCSPLRKQASCTLHSFKHEWQKPAQEYASVSRMAHTTNLNSFHMLPKNCDRMPLTNKWVDCLASTEKARSSEQQLLCSPVCLGFSSAYRSPVLLTALNAASYRDPPLQQHAFTDLEPAASGEDL